jgi:hypothetical protein
MNTGATSHSRLLLIASTVDHHNQLVHRSTANGIRTRTGQIESLVNYPIIR